MRTFATTLLLLLTMNPYWATRSQENCWSLFEKNQVERSWQELDKTYRNALQKQFDKISPLLLEDFKKKSGHTKILQQMGVQFRRNRIIAPPIQQLSKRVSHLVNESVKSWNSKYPHDLILPNDVIKMGFTFKNAKSHWITLTYGDPIPEGYRFEAMATPAASLYSSLSQGLFPLSIGKGITFHDLAHLTGYIEHPNYMRAYKKLAFHIVNNGVNPVLDSSPSLYHRIYYFNESLVLVSPDKLKNVIYLFSIPSNSRPSFGQYSYSYYQIYHEVSKLPVQTVIANSQKLIRALPTLLQEMGGGARDTYHKQAYSHEYYHLNTLVVNLENSIHGAMATGNTFAYQQAREDTAALQAALLTLSEISVESWLAQTMAPENKKQSVNYLYSSDSGIYLRDNYKSQAYSYSGKFHSDHF